MDDALERIDVADKDGEEREVHMLPPMMVNPKCREALSRIYERLRDAFLIGGRYFLEGVTDHGAYYPDGLDTDFKQIIAHLGCFHIMMNLESEPEC